MLASCGLSSKRVNCSLRSSVRPGSRPMLTAIHDRPIGRLEQRPRVRSRPAPHPLGTDRSPALPGRARSCCRVGALPSSHRASLAPSMSGSGVADPAWPDSARSSPESPRPSAPGRRLRRLRASRVHGCSAVPAAAKDHRCRSASGRTLRTMDLSVVTDSAGRRDRSSISPGE